MMHARPFLLSSLATAAVLAYLCGACSSSSSRQCNVGADCASGACNADGTCVPPSSTDGGKDGAAAEGGAGSSDGGGGATDASFDFDAGPGCKADKDGIITHDEVPLGPGLKATFIIATSETIDTAGTKNADGTYTWDFTGKLASDQSGFVQTLSPMGTYWAADFAKASYASKLSQESTLLGVFDYGATTLSLLGDVSPTKTGGSTDTELTYATPIPILQFPFMLGSSWTTASDATGTFQGNTIVAAEYNEKYETTVDKAGTVKTPFATFQALRVATLLTQTVTVFAVQTITITRTYAWVTECYGTIAKATSVSTKQMVTAPAPPPVDFTQSAELMRISQ